MNALNNITAAVSATIRKLSAASQHYYATYETEQKVKRLSESWSVRSSGCRQEGGSSSAFELVSTGEAERSIVLKVFNVAVCEIYALAVFVAAGQTSRKRVVKIKPTSVAR